MIKLDLEILIVILFLIFTNKKYIEYFSNYTQLKRFDSCLKSYVTNENCYRCLHDIGVTKVQLKLDQKQIIVE